MEIRDESMSHVATHQKNLLGCILCTSLYTVLWPTYKALLAQRRNAAAHVFVVQALSIAVVVPNLAQLLKS